MKELLPASAGNQIEILIGGKPAGFVQKLTVQARREQREAEQFAPQAGKGRQTLLGKPQYRLSLFQYRPAGPFVQPDLFELWDFSLTVRQDGRGVVYSGCRWTELKQTVEPDGVWYNVMELTAGDRTEESESK